MFSLSRYYLRQTEPMELPIRIRQAANTNGGS